MDIREEIQDLASDIETELMIESLEKRVGHLTQEDIDKANVTPIQLTDEEKEAILLNRARAEEVLRQKYGYFNTSNTK
jgi:hypothetical protein